MIKYSASGIGDIIYQRLLNNGFRFSGQIHSVFTRVINFIWEKELYTIGKAFIGNGPHTVLLEVLANDLDKCGLKPGDMIKGDKQGIFLGDKLWVDIHEAKLWDSSYNPKEGVNFDQIDSLMFWMKELIIREGDLSGLGLLVDLWDNDHLNPGMRSQLHYRHQIILLEALGAIQKIKKGFLTKPQSFKDGIIQLIGLGPGLTPAGDDFLIGLFLVLHYLEAVGILDKFADIFLRGLQLDSPEFTAEVKKNTNLISGTAILLAIQGRSVQLIKNVILNIFSGKKVETTLSVVRLIDRGVTSGTDILTGIFVGYQIFKKINKYIKTRDGTNKYG